MKVLEQGSSPGNSLLEAGRQHSYKIKRPLRLEERHLTVYVVSLASFRGKLAIARARLTLCPKADNAGFLKPSSAFPGVSCLVSDCISVQKIIRAGQACAEIPGVCQQSALAQR